MQTQAHKMHPNRLVRILLRRIPSIHHRAKLPQRFLRSPRNRHINRCVNHVAERWDFRLLANRFANLVLRVHAHNNHTVDVFGFQHRLQRAVRINLLPVQQAAQPQIIR